MKNLHPIPARLAQARRDARIPQREIAARAYVTHKTLCNWENGITSPNIADAARWADALGMRLTLTEPAEVPRCVSCNGDLVRQGDVWAHLGSPGCDDLTVPEASR